MSPKIVFERKALPHDPGLYAGEASFDGVEGFAGIHAQHLEAYRNSGYLVIRGAFSLAEMEQARNELRRMTLMEDPECESVYYEGEIRDHLQWPESDQEQENGGSTLNSFILGQVSQEVPLLPAALRSGYVRKFMGFTATHPPLQSIAHKPALLELVQRLIGEPPVLFQEMAMIKPPGGREKPWHQDHAYFNLPLDTRVAGAWIALGDVNPENGCMFVIPGGHTDGPRPHFMRRDWQICDTEIRESNCKALPMKTGDLLLFDAKLPHGTPVNRTKEFRWALQFHYLGQQVRTTSDQERLEAFGNEGKNVTC